MSDNIERTIYRLELDDAAYTAGVDRAVASTKKLSESQGGANKKFDELEDKIKNIGKTPIVLPQIKFSNESLLEIQKLKQEIQGLQSSGKNATNEINNLLGRIEAQKGLIQKLNTELGKVANSNKVAFDEAPIKKYEVEIVKLKSEVESLKVKAVPAFSQVGDEVKKTSGVLGGAKAKVLDLAKSFFTMSVIPLIITGVVTAVKDLFNWITKASSARRAQNELEKDAVKISVEAREASQKERVELQALLVIAKDHNKSLQEREAAVKRINDRMPPYLEKIKLETINTKETSSVIEQYIKSIDAKARAQAYIATIQQKYNKLIELEASLTMTAAYANKAYGPAVRKRLESDINALNIEIDGLQNRFNEDLKTGKASLDLRTEAKKNAAEDLREKKKTTKEIIQDGKDAFNEGQRLIKKGIQEAKEKLREDKRNAAASRRAQREEEKNDFDKRKAELTGQISALAAKEYETELSIKRQYRDKLNKALLDIDKDKFISANQKSELKKLAGVLNDAELNKALTEYKKKITDARKKLNDELQDIEDQNTSDQIRLIQDDFERRAKLIEFNEKKELSDAQRLKESRISNLNEQYKRGQIDTTKYYVALGIIIDEGEQQANNIIAKHASDRKDLSADAFKKLLDSYKSGLDEGLLIRDEALIKRLAGKSVEEIKKALKEEDKIQKAATLENNKNQLKELDNRIASTIDKTTKEYADLLELQKDYRRKIADQEKQVPEEDKFDVLGSIIDPEAAKKLARIDFIQDKIQSVATSVISFWQTANEAEQKSLDRSISIQEKRVEAAQRIAERGNAQYLKAEQDRLTELQVKRENAARKQLGIDAALQASQILVGITGAIAKIATPGIGLAESIAAMTVIFSSLAAGYGLVKSLQGNQPHLAEGTTYLTRGKNKSGVDTIPAMLNEGEAVLPADTNKAYHPAVKAIYDGTIPADHMNNFVKHYHKIKTAPRTDYDRIGAAAQMRISSDGKMAILLSENNKKLDEQNDLTRQTLRALKSMGVNVNMDKNGLAVSVMEVTDQLLKDKRV